MLEISSHADGAATQNMKSFIKRKVATGRAQLRKNRSRLSAGDYKKQVAALKAQESLYGHLFEDGVSRG